MTQGQRVLSILSDGKPHAHGEFYGFCVLHSRVSELRKKGFNIACWRDGDDYVYQLLSELGTVRAERGQGSAASGGNPSLLGQSPTSGCSSVGPGSFTPRKDPGQGQQLSVWESAA